jgi:hypothetical protein
MDSHIIAEGMVTDSHAFPSSAEVTAIPMAKAFKYCMCFLMVLCAGENLERERFMEHVDMSYHAAMQFAGAKAWLEAANRSGIHASLLILFGLGGWLVFDGQMPLRVMLTGIGFTYSLMYATQVCALL